MSAMRIDSPELDRMITVRDAYRALDRFWPLTSIGARLPPLISFPMLGCARMGSDNRLQGMRGRPCLAEESLARLPAPLTIVSVGIGELALPPRVR